MAIRRGIAELFEAIPERIEVSGQAPTWRVTGGSFESAVDYANEAFDEPVVLARRDRSRWWPRVTLTVTTDPELAAEAPPLEALTDPDPSDPAAESAVESATVPEAPRHRSTDLPARRAAGAEHDEDFESFLDEAFARQEAWHAGRAVRLPGQRRRVL